MNFCYLSLFTASSIEFFQHNYWNQLDVVRKKTTNKLWLEVMLFSFNHKIYNSLVNFIPIDGVKVYIISQIRKKKSWKIEPIKIHGINWISNVEFTEHILFCFPWFCNVSRAKLGLWHLISGCLMFVYWNNIDSSLPLVTFTMCCISTGDNSNFSTPNKFGNFIIYRKMNKSNESR